VDADAMTTAIGLAAYFIDHAQRAFDLMLGRRALLEPAPAVLRWIKRKKLTVFSVRDAWRGLQGQTWATSTEDVRDAIEDLEERGWVRLVPPRNRPEAPAESPLRDTPVAASGAPHMTWYADPSRAGAPRAPRAPRLARRRARALGQLIHSNSPDIGIAEHVGLDITGVATPRRRLDE
jgi:hypothetical protein